jgi:hypothetical protein
LLDFNGVDDVEIEYIPAPFNDPLRQYMFVSQGTQEQLETRAKNSLYEAEAQLEQAQIKMREFLFEDRLKKFFKNDWTVHELLRCPELCAPFHDFLVLQDRTKKLIREKQEQLKTIAA